MFRPLFVVRLGVGTASHYYVCMPSFERVICAFEYVSTNVLFEVKRVPGFRIVVSTTIVPKPWSFEIYCKSCQDAKRPDSVSQPKKSNLNLCVKA